MMKDLLICYVYSKYTHATRYLYYKRTIRISELNIHHMMYIVTTIFTTTTKLCIICIILYLSYYNITLLFRVNCRHYKVKRILTKTVSVINL